MGSTFKSQDAKGQLPAWLRARSRRSKLPTYVVCVAVVLLLTFFHFDSEPLLGQRASSRFHVVVPVTGKDINLCKLYLSAFANGYPTPIIVNWEDQVEFDSAKQLESRVKGVHDYLSKLKRAGGHDKDIVLLVDGTDVMFQLGPEVLLSNYFQSIHNLDRHVEKNYGRSDIRHTILFGAEKHCWPYPLTRPTCWLTPKSDLSAHVYGPYTTGQLSAASSYYTFPRWLNSGTIMGPVDHLLRMYQRLLDHILDDPVKGAEHQHLEQSHFDALFAMQEHSRLNKRPEIVEDRFKDTFKVRMLGGDPMREITTQQDELHMGIDYGASLFMPLMWQEPFLMWIKPSAAEIFPNASANERRLQSFYNIPLPAALQRSPPPFAILEDAQSTEVGWSDVNLLHNVATRSIPPVIHFTVDHLRDPWWEKLWFQDKARLFRVCRMEEGRQGQRVSESRIDGRYWFNGVHVSQVPAKPEDANNASLPGAGVWTTDGNWITWEHTCGEYEQWLYA